MAWHSDKYGLRSEYHWALSEDNLWRVIENKTSEGESYRLEYDDINLTRIAYWHDGSTSFWQLNHDHQIIHYTDRTGIKTALIWDEFGLPCGCRNALGHTHLSEWDALGRLLSITDGNGNQTHWQYQNERERLITVFWPDNTESRLAYDSLGRLVEEAHLGDRVFTSAPRTILLDYDAAGNLVKRETLTDRYQYQWDSMNRLLVASKQPNQRGLEMGLQANQSPFYLRCTWPHYS
ncbi:TPA: RHS repeat protein [Proteus mirabilis]|nr:RHS repeat protein [Proteus mirabilis]